MQWRKRTYDLPAVQESYGDKTFAFQCKRKVVRVHPQLINSFQHGYASALTAFELGAPVSEFLFKSNEYFEAAVGRNAGTNYFYRDTKKDIFNNAIGRDIGSEARDRKLSSTVADDYMITRVLEALNERVLITHCLDPRVDTLPSLEQSGYPILRDIQKLHGTNE